MDTHSLISLKNYFSQIMSNKSHLFPQILKMVLIISFIMIIQIGIVLVCVTIQKYPGQISDIVPWLKSTYIWDTQLSNNNLKHLCSTRYIAVCFCLIFCRWVHVPMIKHIVRSQMTSVRIERTHLQQLLYVVFITPPLLNNCFKARLKIIC